MNPDIWTLGAVVFAFAALWLLYGFRRYMRAVNRGELD